jgi:hypothetical protein
MLLGSGLLIWNIGLVSQVYPRAIPVPVRTVPPVMPASATKVELDFGPMILKGYELTRENKESHSSMLGVNLYWVVEEFVGEDYLTTVSLVDRQGEKQSSWIGYGANGRYPSRAWEPGDIIRDELYLPLVGLQSGAYTVTLQIGRTHSYLIAENGANVLALAQVDLPSFPSSPPTSRQAAPKVWQTGQVTDRLPVFEHKSTVQITADSEVDLRLIGLDQVARPPITVAGQTHVFVVESLWPKGDYYLSTQSNYQSKAESSTVLIVQGESRQTEIPPIQTETNANFANYIKLLGYDTPGRTLTPGEPLPLVLYWQALQVMPTDFIMFIRMYDDAGNEWAGYDRWPREYYSPMMWVTNEVVEDGFTININPSTPSGVYYLNVGFYLIVGEAPVSLPLVQEGKLSEVTHFTIGPFRVEG